MDKRYSRPKRYPAGYCLVRDATLRVSKLIATRPSEGDAMSLKKILLPAAALLLVTAFLASHASSQTMGEYATTTAGVGTGSGSMGTTFAMPPSMGSSDTGGRSRTLGGGAPASRWGEEDGG